MPKLQSLAALLAASALLAVAAPAVAAPVTVNLRVEGPSSTIYEGPVTTDVHQVGATDISTHQYELHDCDGVNNGSPANPFGYPAPAPTTVSTLDDGAKQNAFSWAGSWYSDYKEIFVDNVGTEPMPPGAYWTFLVNWKTDPDHGGCENQVHSGDDVVWAAYQYGSPFLQLAGTPTRAATGEAFTVTVQDQDSLGHAAPDAGASVGGQMTDAQGHATISFADAGQHTLKATKAGTVRSNAQSVCVYVPGSGDCGTDRPAGESPQSDQTPAPQPAPAVKDTTPPVVTVGSITPGKTYTNGPRVLSGTADDAGGIYQVFLRLRATDGGDLTSASRCRWFSGKRGVFTNRTVPCSKARFFRIGANPKFSYLLPSRLGKGKYVLDVKVLDRSYNAGRAAVPFKVK